MFFGKVRKLYNLSKDRIQPRCKICTSCGGCQYQQLDYNAQLKYKTKRVKEALTRIAHVKQEVLPCLGMDDPYNYRNKIQVPFNKDRNGKVKFGFYKENTHIIMPIKDGTTSNGTPYRSFTCSNNEAGCDFFETRYGDLTPPGIQITEGTTAQDVERMRENRRRLRK